MRAHVIDPVTREILNTIVVASLDDFPNLVDAEAGGQIGDLVPEDGQVVTVPPEPEPVDQVVKRYMAAVQAHMDAHAVSFGYDHLLAVISYAEEAAVPRYQSEGLAFRAWRSLCWAHCEQVFADVMAEQRPIPTVPELLAELPTAPVQEPL